jgi:RNase P subunit RPR2
MDIFENTIICKKCNKAMKPTLVSKNGFNLRTVKCEKCGEIIVHPTDKQEYEEFMRLKEKEYNVKMRMVGNSYAVSIPREIVDFMREQESMIDNMVKLSFEKAGRLSLMFNTNEDENARAVSMKEVKIVKNGKVFHAKQFSDSAHPEKNKTQIIKNGEQEE